MIGAVGRRARGAALIGAGCAAVFVVVFLLAIWTTRGQRFEDAVLAGAGTATARGGEWGAEKGLDLIRLKSFALAVLVVVAIGLWRRLWAVTTVAVGVALASVFTVELLQHTIYRPILLDIGYRREDQSFPSGHAATAMSVAVALLLVIPYRLRWYAIVLTAPWAIGVGVATVGTGWHRPSDTLGSDLIVVLYACVAVAILARAGLLAEPAARRAPRHARLHVAIGAAVLLVEFAASAALLDFATALRDGLDAGNAFRAGVCIAFASSVCALLTVLALLRGLETSAAKQSVLSEPRQLAESVQRYP